MLRADIGRARSLRGQMIGLTGLGKQVAARARAPQAHGLNRCITRRGYRTSCRPAPVRAPAGIAQDAMPCILCEKCARSAVSISDRNSSCVMWISAS